MTVYRTPWWESGIYCKERCMEKKNLKNGEWKAFYKIDKTQHLLRYCTLTCIDELNPYNTLGCIIIIIIILQPKTQSDLENDLP